MAHAPSNPADRDATPRSRVEALYEQILDSLASGVIAFDADGVVVLVNHAARQHLGVSQEQLAKGMRLEDLLLVKPFVKAIHGVMRMHQPVSRQEIVVPQPDGSKRELGFSASLIEGPQDFNGAVFLFVDMTERRNLERAAELNRQLAQIGELTAGVVHELRNPLQVISGMAELLQRKTVADDSRLRHIDAIISETKGLERLVSQFLGFAKPFEPEITVCSVRTIIERAMELCKPRFEAKHIVLESHVEAAMPDIHADGNMLSQVIVNIVNNAIDAVSEGGCVTVAARREGPDILMEVTDNGPGIHLKPGEDLFQPFFSRKESGTGLGLAICHRIVTAHAGCITYGNNETVGASFVVRVPIQKGRL